MTKRLISSKKNLIKSLKIGRGLLFYDAYVYIYFLVHILMYVCIYDRKNSHMEKDKDDRWVCLYPGCGKPNLTGIHTHIYVHTYIHTYVQVLCWYILFVGKKFKEARFLEKHLLLKHSVGMLCMIIDICTYMYTHASDTWYVYIHLYIYVYRPDSN